MCRNLNSQIRFLLGSMLSVNPVIQQRIPDTQKKSPSAVHEGLLFGQPKLGSGGGLHGWVEITCT